MITQKVDSTRKQKKYKIKGLTVFILPEILYHKDFRSKVSILESVSEVSIRDSNLCKPGERLEIFFQRRKKQTEKTQHHQKETKKTQKTTNNPPKKAWAVERDPAASSSQVCFLNGPWKMLVKQDLRCH